MTPLADGHLDLAWNVTAFGRDPTQPLQSLREADKPASALDQRETPTVTLHEMHRAGMLLFHGTLFSRARPGALAHDNLRRVDLDYPTPDAAHAAALAQLGYYHLLGRRGVLRIIQSSEDLASLRRTANIRRAAPPIAAPDHHPENTSPDAQPPAQHDQPIGCIILMEGADPVTSPDELAFWKRQGVRAISLTHTGQARCAAGNAFGDPPPRTHALANGQGLTPLGRDMLTAVEQLNLTLDLSHLADLSFFQTIDHFQGPIIASHTNCRRFAPGERQFTDEQIRLIIERRGVIGIALHISMLKANTPRKDVSLKHAAEHIDHICQLAGNADHVAIGSDLDGGFGVESSPADLDSIADLPTLLQHLAQRGATPQDLDRIAFDNWADHWRTAFERDDDARNADPQI